MVDEEKKKKYSKCILIVGALVSIGMSIYSFVNALATYQHLVEIKEDYLTLVDHWESKPLIDVTLLPYNTISSCPGGYVEGIVADNDRKVDQTIGQWPGKLAWCDCRPQGFDYTYTYTEMRCDCGSTGKSCTTKEKDGKKTQSCSYSTSWGAGACSTTAKSNGCSTDSRKATATVIFYTGSGSCHENATEAGCRTDAAISRIGLHSWRKHRICYKRGGWSAIERIDRLTDNLTDCTEGVICQAARYPQENIYTICAPDEDSCPLTSLGPLNQISANNNNFTKIHNGNANNNSILSENNNEAADPNIPQKRPIVDVRTTIGYPCWKGTFGQNGRSNNERVANKYDSDCQVNDNRFIFWDELKEPILYNENNVPVSGHHILGDLSISPYQYFNESFDVNWTISYRNEIYWKSDCQVGNIKSLSWYLKPLKHLTTLEETLVIMNGIFGLGFLGLLLPILTVLHITDSDNDLSCIPGKGEQEFKNINRLKGIIKILSTLGKFIPLIISVVVTDQVNWFFSNVGKAKCSDNLTNNTMLDVGNEIERIKQGNERNLIVDSLLLVWTSVMLIKEIYDSRKEKKTQENDKNVAMQEPGAATNGNNNNNNNENNDQSQAIKLNSVAASSIPPGSMSPAEGQPFIVQQNNNLNNQNQNQPDYNYSYAVDMQQYAYPQVVPSAPPPN